MSSVRHVRTRQRTAFERHVQQRMNEYWADYWHDVQSPDHKTETLVRAPKYPKVGDPRPVVDLAYLREEEDRLIEESAKQARKEAREKKRAASVEYQVKQYQAEQARNKARERLKWFMLSTTSKHLGECDKCLRYAPMGVVQEIPEYGYDIIQCVWCGFHQTKRRAQVVP